MIIDFYNRGNGGGGTGTTYNSIRETADSTRIANQYIDLEGALSINGESFEENVIANEADPVWNREKNNYFTKDESDARYELKPFDPSTGATSSKYVYITFNDGTEPRYDYFSNGSIPVRNYRNDKTIVNVWIGEGIKIIDIGAFEESSNIENVYIANGVTTINSSAFHNCTSIVSVILPDTLVKIGDGAFQGCSALSAINIPDSVTNFGSYVFFGCRSLTNIVFPDKITTIPSTTCQACKALTSVTIGKSVETIGGSAFLYCDKLNEITTYAKVEPVISENAFKGVASAGTVYYPSGSDYSSWMNDTYLSGWTFVEMEATLEERVEANENSIDGLDERVTALEEGGGGGIPQALHYESEWGDEEGNPYREVLDINKDDGIYFHRSDDENGVHSAYMFRDALQYNDADDEEGTNMRACNVGPYGIDILYDEPEMPATHIGYGSVEVTNAEVKMTMSTDEGFMGALTMSEEGEPIKGVILQPDGTFNLFVDDVTTDKSFVYLMNEDGININGNPQPIMQVLTKAEYDALETKQENIMYIVKG